MTEKPPGRLRWPFLTSVAVVYLILLWVVVQPLHASLKRKQAGAFQGAGRQVEAAQTYDQLTSILPWEVSYWIAAGDWAQEQAEESEDPDSKARFFELAAKRFERAQRLQPSNPGLPKKVASLYTDWARDLDESKFQSADRWWSKAVSNQPKDWTAHRSYGVMLNSWATEKGNDLKTYRRSLKHLLKASRLKPDNFDIWTYIGKTYVALSEPDKAKSALEKALKLQPDYLEASDLLKRLTPAPAAPPPASPSPGTP